MNHIKSLHIQGPCDNNDSSRKISRGATWRKRIFKYTFKALEALLVILEIIGKVKDIFH